MGIPTVTREYTLGSCRTLRNPLRHPPRRDMRLDSPALPAEPHRIPNQTRKEPRFSYWNTRESPRTLSQYEMKTDVTSGMQNSSVYPKSTRDEPHFPFIGSITIPCSTAYSKSGLTSFSKLQRFPETTISSLYEYCFQYSNSRKAPCTPYHLKMRADSLSLTEEVRQLSTSTSSGVFPQQ